MEMEVWLLIPLSRLVACILAWARADDVSRMTTDRSKRPTRESWEGENVLIFHDCINFGFTTVAF